MSMTAACRLSKTDLLCEQKQTLLSLPQSVFEHVYVANCPLITNSELHFPKNLACFIIKENTYTIDNHKNWYSD